ncbi:SDR family NAD(P)-dependent oxidoreductase [Treponema sp. OMZ 305]|uniref:SDR family NAD(P)-dependent oxidoreductase n=1 Tax=Treponema TaxID=157 RepID=UPI001BB03F4B|nr:MULTISPECIES: SDR family NAD(P)-dependent oxidoreductase [Treponema]QUY17464.1 SDR family NAD(P)-dependent oxidoreductase [Treponema vincentii]UTC57318.1 SDR family NAD(P)-dependent oxidoreductase [Treponema sp. OMZ 305]
MEYKKEVKKIAVVTGGTSGIGFETVKALRDRDYRVYTVSRRMLDVQTPEGEGHFSADVTDEYALTKVFAEVWEREARLDVCVCAAGFGISGAVEFTKLEDAKKQLEVNFFGAFLTMKIAASYMRKQGFGKILAVSSVAGEIAIPFQAFYSASKAALGKLLEAFAAEIFPFGIQCALIMPGDVATPFTDVRNKSNAGNDVYFGRITKSISKMEHDERHGIPAEKLGSFIASLADKKRIGFFYPYNASYALLISLYRLLPRSLALFIVRKLYAC